MTIFFSLGRGAEPPDLPENLITYGSRRFCVTASFAMRAGLAENPQRDLVRSQGHFGRVPIPESRNRFVWNGHHRFPEAHRTPSTIPFTIHVNESMMMIRRVPKP